MRQLLSGSAITLVMALPLSSGLAACTGDSQNSLHDRDSASATSAPLKAASLPPGDPAWQSPLERQLGGRDQIVDLIVRGQAKNAELVASCMVGRGFDDKPPVRSRGSLTLDYYIARYGATVSDPGYRTRWGYGIATRFRPDGSQYRNEGAWYVDGPDPAVETTATRTPSQEIAYQKALTGFDPSAPPPANKAASQAVAASGCLGVADGTAAKRYPAYASIIDFLSSIDASSPGVGRAAAKWEECMRKLGYNVGDRFNPAPDLAADVDRLANSGAIDPTQLAALQARELSMASHDWDCRQSSTLTAELNRSLERVEQAFVERASDLLEQLQEQGP